MTLSSILDPFKEHDLEALSRKAKQAAAGCGKQVLNDHELPFEDWCVLDDMVRSNGGNLTPLGNS
jgi:hypothetical protein